MNKIDLINQVVKLYFDHNRSQVEVPAKDLMPYFIKAGTFVKDEKNGLPIRKVLRDLDKKNQLHLIPFVYADRKKINTNWYFRRTSGVELATKLVKATSPKKYTTKSMAKTTDRDEAYVLDLCDEVLQLKGLRQHKFDFLTGDSGRRLPVDIYYPTLNLVVEYRETQHSNEVKFFDKPDKMTVSGVSRGEQRKIYDQRRRDVLPQNGIQLIEIDYTDFEHDKKHRIIRDKEKDLEVVRGKLRQAIF